MKLFKPNVYTEDSRIRNPNDENFLFEIGDKNSLYVREKVITFETNDIIVKYSVDLGFNVIEIPYAYGEANIYFKLHQTLFLFKNMKLQH